MDGVSSVFAVLSLAFQLFDTVHKTSGFLKDVQDAPNELIELSATLEQLDLILAEVNHLLQEKYMVLRLPGSPIVLLGALGQCDRRTKPLQAIVQEVEKILRQGDRARRTWASFKLVTKKERLRELQTQLRDAKSDLSTAILLSLSQVQMNHLQLTIDASRTIIESVNSQHSESREPLWSSVVQDKTARYSGILGEIKVDTKSDRGANSQFSRTEGPNSLLQETSIVITPSSLRRRFEILLKCHFGQITRTLRIYPVIPRESPFFQMCRNGDIDGIHTALSAGGMSPFVVDKYSRTALHWAAEACSPELCTSLLGMGLDPHRPSDHGGSAIIGLGGMVDYPGHEDSISIQAKLDTLRILGEAHKDGLSAQDLVYVWDRFRGPPQDLELLYHQSTILMGYEEEDSLLMSTYVLVQALRLYGGGDPRYQCIIRRMIQKGVNIHSQVCYGYVNEPYEWVSDFDAGKDESQRKGYRKGTLLDELFSETESPVEAESAARDWLCILWCEGIDCFAYLKREFDLHAAQQQLTYSGEYGTTRRQLVFQLGETPSVWWEWLLDPESGGYLVREEFKAMYMMWDDLDDLGTVTDPKRDVWPFDFPNWSPGLMPTEELGKDLLFEYFSICLHAEERFERRWKRKAPKMARARRTEGPRKIPGGWPA